MKWNEQLTEKLKELCYEGKTNSEIASVLRCKLPDVYSKRSALGITIDKVKGITSKPEFKKTLKPVEKVAAPTKQSGRMHKDVREAFKALNQALLVVVARDETGLEEAKFYSELSRILLDIESWADTALQMRK